MTSFFSSIALPSSPVIRTNLCIGLQNFQSLVVWTKSGTILRLGLEHAPLMPKQRPLQTLAHLALVTNKEVIQETSGPLFPEKKFGCVKMYFGEQKNQTLLLAVRRIEVSAKEEIAGRWSLSFSDLPFLCSSKVKRFPWKEIQNKSFVKSGMSTHVLKKKHFEFPMFLFPSW